MRAFDSRLLRHARATRGYLALSVVVGLAQATLIVVQAYFLATILTRAVVHDEALASLLRPIGLLCAAVVGRAVFAWAAEVVAHRTSAAVKQELRSRCLHQIIRLGPRWMAGRRSGELTTLVTRGIDALDSYFSRYLPQLVLCALIPTAVVVVLLATDVASGLVVALSLPLVPAGLVGFGVLTRRRVERQWTSLQALAHHFLDILSGLGTLKAFGRSRVQVSTIARLADQQRRASLSTMRLAFLSSLALELVAALAVAVVAVTLAHRLLEGVLDLRSALLVLLLAPEAYGPLRQVATHYHASTEGLGAAAAVFEILEQPQVRVDTHATTDIRTSVDPFDIHTSVDAFDIPTSVGPPAVALPDPRTTAIRLDEVTVLGADRAQPLLDRLSMELTPGQVTGLVAPSGTGKSTVLAVLLGFVVPDSGRVLVGDADLTTLDADAWRSQVGWLPQDPVLFAGTVGDNITLRDPHADLRAVREAARFAAVDLPLTHSVGERGFGLSAGQRRRVALARALLHDKGLLLLDEPTEGVDPDTESALLAALPPVLAGRTVVLVTHRPGLLRLCQHVVRLDRLVMPA